VKKLKQNKLIEEIQQIRSTNSDLTSTARAITMMWKLNKETNSIFSELDLLLTINPEGENIKMKKGLIKVGKDLIEKGQRLIDYTNNSANIIIEEE